MATMKDTGNNYRLLHTGHTQMYVLYHLHTIVTEEIYLFAQQQTKNPIMQARLENPARFIKFISLHYSISITKKIEINQ